jgi:hypothetical protein
VTINYLNKNRIARESWDGYESFKVYSDKDGKLFENGTARYAIFFKGQLVCEEGDLTKANRLYIQGALVDPIVYKKDYLGIDRRLREYANM